MPKFHLTKDEILQREREGISLLSFSELSVDWSAVRHLFDDLVDLVADFFPSSPAKRFHDISDLKQVTKAWYEGESLEGRTEFQGSENEAILTMAIHSALWPFLSIQSEVLLPLVEQKLWRRGNCPICGGKPDFAFLDKEKGARWLLCSRCDAQWLFQRLRCPYCGNQNQETLAYFTDDEELYRLYVCEECKGYLKSIDLRKADSEVLLPLERILTLDLDNQAHEAGYE